MQPTLVDFPVDGKTVPALIVGTKMGQLFVLDRLTGKPLTKVIEQPVKSATIPGEPYAKTQPLSIGMPQIGADVLKGADMWGMTPVDQMMCRIIFHGMRYDGLFTAPDTDTSLSFPGSLGGMNWGGLSYDPNAGMIFVNDMRPRTVGSSRQGRAQGRHVEWQRSSERGHGRGAARRHAVFGDEGSLLLAARHFRVRNRRSAA